MFIALEGIDGSGKTTMSNHIANYLRSKGQEVLLTREPTDFARSMLLGNDLYPVSELLLFFADRFEHFKKEIEPAIDAGKWVICDRYIASSFAYQVGGRGVRKSLAMECAKGLQQPDYTFCLSCSPETSRQRVKNPDRFETQDDDFYSRVRQAYLEYYTDDPDCIWINADFHIDSVRSAIMHYLEGWV